MFELVHFSIKSSPITSVQLAHSQLVQNMNTSMGTEAHNYGVQTFDNYD